MRQASAWAPASAPAASAMPAPLTPRGITPRLPAATGAAAAAALPAQKPAPPTSPKQTLAAKPPASPRGSTSQKPSLGLGAMTARVPASSTISATAGAASAPRGCLTARETARSKLGLQLPARNGEFSDAEQTAKESKLKLAEGECTRIGDTGMFIGGEMVARDAALLNSHKITHVLNMAGVIIPNFHEKPGAIFKYCTLYLHDGGEHAGEDFRSALPNVLEWLDAALRPPTSAKVLVHCQAGVSRSCSAVIAYLMWARGLVYTDSLAYVKSHRTVASPNMAFFTMLLEWEQTRLSQLSPAPALPAVKPAAGLGGDELWIYQVCRQGQPKDPSTMLVTKLLRPPRSAASSDDEAVGLDPRGCFILRTAGGIHGWIGTGVAGDDPCRVELQSALQRIRRYEWPKEAAAAGEISTETGPAAQASSVDDKEPPPPIDRSLEVRLCLPMLNTHFPPQFGPFETHFR